MCKSTTNNKELSVFRYETEKEIRKVLIENEKQWLINNNEKQQQNVDDELSRLIELMSFSSVFEVEKSDNDENHKVLNEITERVRETFNASWACVCLIDIGLHHVKSYAEAPNKPFQLKDGGSRTDSFCNHTILQDGIMVVTDTVHDDRFNRNKHVINSPYFRFYAAIPLKTYSGHKIGTLCVLDPKERPDGITSEQGNILQIKAKEVMQYYQKRRDELQTIRKRGSSQDLAQVEQETRLVEESKLIADNSLVAMINPTTNNKLVTNGLKKDVPGKKSRSSSPCPTMKTKQNSNNNSNTKIVMPAYQPILPSPKTSNIDPDEYLALLVEGMYPGVKLKIKSANTLNKYFPDITEEQMSRYSTQVVNMARCNNVIGLRQLYKEQGRDALDCFNRFGEGLLNMACRRGFKDMVQFLLSNEINLNVRIRDDYGRSPLHDCCWNPEPQLDIAKWIIQRDPSLFLVADKRGFTPFQYARKSDWHIWRQFLFDNRDYLIQLTSPDMITTFTSS